MPKVKQTPRLFNRIAANVTVILWSVSTITLLMALILGPIWFIVAGGTFVASILVIGVVYWVNPKQGELDNLPLVKEALNLCASCIKANSISDEQLNILDEMIELAEESEDYPDDAASRIRRYRETTIDTIRRHGGDWKQGRRSNRS